ncbi:hypothetical protein BAE44_0001568 [Dichanthelium oligosanthes]|uniref:Uncharacterized protein n=1 Tax=Dichanthelium oligosanthes TaxID=888268 RepID=A0A1E5WJ60_9POAL|nr:hypothetical protein BAE44_0001568 [Dichanthelium oligosanthes]
MAARMPFYEGPERGSKNSGRSLSPSRAEKRWRRSKACGCAVRLLQYIAGQSRPEMHAAQLTRGGELLTFIWLLMAHSRLRDFDQSIELVDVFPEKLMQLSSESSDSP